MAWTYHIATNGINWVSLLKGYFMEYVKTKLLAGIKKTETDCWLYKNSTSGIYSKMRIAGKWESAHRMSYRAFVGEIPAGMLVCHKCDTPKCVNPDHLFIGTQKDNAQDRKAKGRGLVGDLNHFARLTDIQRYEIGMLKKYNGFDNHRLARIFNISERHLRRILNNFKE